MHEALTYSDLQPNATLGHYTLVEHIADGGMGHVYRAFEPSLQRDVAIKVLKSEFAQDEEVLSQFEMEAQNIAALRHPNIVPVYYVGHQGELYFFVMPFITGQTLDVWVDTKYRATLEEAKWILYQAADALDRAFSQQIIHLDIKPSNFLVDESGAILLTDFGLAKVLGKNADVESEECFGTPAYMCPEQILRKSTDQRSDIYSLGATMFHMITGQFLFQSDSITELVKAHLHEPFPFERALELGLPPGWIHLLEKMVKKNPDERYQDYVELREAIDNVERLSPVHLHSDDEGAEENAGKPVSVPIMKPSPETIHGLLGKRCQAWTEVGIEDGIERPRDEVFAKLASTKVLKLDEFTADIKEISSSFASDMSDLAEAVSMVPEVDEYIAQLGQSELVAGTKVIETRRQAIRQVGSDLSGQILLAGVMIQKLMKEEEEFTWTPYWQQAVATGVVAHILLRTLKGEYIPGKGSVDLVQKTTITSAFRKNVWGDADTLLFAAGLFHGIGKLLLAEVAAYPYFAAMSMAQSKPNYLAEEEKKVFGCDHHEVGAAWLGKKRIHSDIRDAALYYNTPERQKNVISSLICVASHVVRIYGIGYGGDPLMSVRNIWKTPAWGYLSSHSKTISLSPEYMDQEFIPLVGTLPLFEI
jgi:serine/threonine protein kinase